MIRVATVDETLRRRPLPPIAPRKRAIVVAESPDRAAIGRSFPLDGRTLVFGRDETVSDPLADRQISRRHLEFAPAGEGYTVEDLRTSNGTWVNGRPLEGS